MSVFTRNEDGEVTNPPVLREYEDRLNRAALAADQREIDRIQDEYNQARQDEIERIESLPSEEEERAQDEEDNRQQQHSGGFLGRRG